MSILYYRERTNMVVVFYGGRCASSITTTGAAESSIDDDSTRRDMRHILGYYKLCAIENRSMPFIDQLQKSEIDELIPQAQRDLWLKDAGVGVSVGTNIKVAAPYKIRETVIGGGKKKDGGRKIIVLD